MASLTATSKSDFLLKYAVAQPGDMIAIPDLAFGTDKFMMNKNGVTVTGGSMSFTPPPGTNTADFGNSASFGIIVGPIDGGGFTGVKLRSTVGLFWMNATSNLTFTLNDFQWATGPVGVGYNALAFYGGSGATNLHIDYNYFHDSPNSNRNLEIWGWSGSYNGNIFENVNDGGHVMNPGDFTFNNNWGRLLHRMGIEVQQSSSTTTDRPVCVATGNTFFDWREPYYDSMGMSLPIQSASFEVSTNYIRHNAVNGLWGIPDNGGVQRGSYGIEAPISGANVHGNVMGSERDVEGVSCPGINTNVHDNQIYGPEAWGAVAGESGPVGIGNAVGTGNVVFPNIADMPAPVSRPTPLPSTPPIDPTPPVNPVSTILSVKQISDTSVQFNISGLPANAYNAIVHSISTVGREVGPVARFRVNAPVQQGVGLKTGWQYDFTAQIVNSSGATVATSNTVTITVAAPPIQPTEPEAAKVIDHVTIFYKDGTSESKP